ncbi:DHA2 family efflux MFS transporter permease subunit [Actinomadura darangshiensis]|uniref:DHA2 family efflux MFS transporter permease subunit n=1 Tax=Actinomadura darangshiensis TaxID=705336 RepID=A0A4V2YYG2_9ACTN|nr:DHA2 family efflux MFS transporter permease subunit [Actinomadura darangshiensis]TDD92917.1 DHA2 family efflux MFS transporter permease subunit [Actinomadura darangshiensis]
MDEDVAQREKATRLSSTQWTTLVLLTLCMFVVVLDATVVLIALPAILSDLGGTLALATWIPAGFALAFAAFLLMFGKLTDIYGRRLMFIAGLVVFSVASLAAALSPSIEFLVGARVVQGVGAAIIEPAIIALIKASFPADRLGLAFGVEGLAAGLAGAGGPIVGGYLATAFSWRYIFVINLPIGLIAIVAAYVLISESRDENADRRLDLPGVLLSGAGLFALVFGIVQGPEYGWASLPIVTAFVAAAVLLTLFVLAESRVANPLLDLSLFRYRLFAVGGLLRGAVEFISLAIFFPLVLFLQVELAYSPLRSGLTLLPFIIGAVIASPLAGSLSDRVDLRWPVVPAMFATAAALFWLAHLAPGTTWTSLIAPLFAAGLTLGALYGPTTSGSLKEIPTEKAGVASAVSYGAVLLGFELGIAVTSGVLQSRFIDELEHAPAGAALPSDKVQQVASSVLTGEGDAGAALASEQVRQFIQTALAHAANAAILSCAAMAVVGGVAGFFFAPRAGRTVDTKGEEPSA